MSQNTPGAPGGARKPAGPSKPTSGAPEPSGSPQGTPNPPDVGITDVREPSNVRPPDKPVPDKPPRRETMGE